MIFSLFFLLIGSVGQLGLFGLCWLHPKQIYPLLLLVCYIVIPPFSLFITLGLNAPLPWSLRSFRMYLVALMSFYTMNTALVLFSYVCFAIAILSSSALTLFVSKDGVLYLSLAMLLGFVGFIPLVYIYKHLLEEEREARSKLGCDSSTPIYFVDSHSGVSGGELSLQQSDG